MDKASAEKEALRLWRARPILERLTFDQAIAFAAMIAPTLPFDTVGNPPKIIEAWLVREVMRTQESAKIIDDQRRADPPARIVDSRTPATPKPEIVTMAPASRPAGAKKASR